ncbi:hypothetical protein VNI00_010926 [Paramarasmius palmivorus]|uniref:Serine-threonine/tyrosine-protein kinase catalytic domain-containing protein n=1 Tax=Paramarasmius palmivorus TaxID=297713 RepID=A0AAW0CF22_9AGAR
MNPEEEQRFLRLLFRDKAAYRQLLSQRGSQAQSLLDWMQKIISGLIPFHGIHPDASVLLAIIEGKRASKPEDTSDELWSLITQCWDNEPSTRPTAEGVLGSLTELLQTSGKEIISAEDWGSQLFAEMQNSVAIDRDCSAKEVAEFLIKVEANCVSDMTVSPALPETEEQTTEESETEEAPQKEEQNGTAATGTRRASPRRGQGYMTGSPGSHSIMLPYRSSGSSIFFCFH